MGERLRRRGTRDRRRGDASRAGAGILRPCTAVLALLVATFGAGATSAGAEEFRRGEAEASAQTFEVNVTQGNANIGFTYGSVIANYRDATGTADAKALDLGVLTTLFGVEQCDGSPAIINPATFPPQTRVDSTEAAASRSRRAAAHMPGMGTGPAGPLAGHQDATATPLPSSRAVTESEPADMYVLALEGGRTDVTTSLRDQVREARAVITADTLTVFGGLFSFTAPRWEALARSGAATTTEGSFTFESATVLGQPRTAEEAMTDLEGFRSGLEQLLAPFGVRLDLPEVQVEGDRVRVTPMAFVLEDMPWGNEVIAPFLGSLQPLREALAQQLLAEDCRNETSLLLLDVLLGILGGSGAVHITAGGVEVFTADTDFSSPELPPLPIDSPAPPIDTGGTDVLGVDDLALGDLGGAGELAPATTPTAEAVGATATTEAPAEDDEELAAVTASVPGAADGATGAAVAVGIAGLVGAVGLSLAERLRARRNSRRIV